MSDKPVMQQDSIAKKEIKRVNGGVVIGVIAALLFVGIAVIVSFSRYLNNQLFLERQTHLLEITEKVAEVVDVVVDAMWGDVGTGEQLLADVGSMDEEELLTELAGMKRYISVEGTTILAFDDMAIYYTSDNHTGYWNDPAIFLPTGSDKQVVVASLPYLHEDDTRMVFIKRLEHPVLVEETDRQITHIGIAMEMERLKNVFAISGFGDNCYTFIVNQEGRRLFKNTYLQEFIEGYNILTAMEKYEIINGGTLEDLKAAVGNDAKACMEFKYGDRNYYVGTSLVPSIKWEIMLFVPTDVLGANTNALLNRTSQYMIIIGGITIVFFWIVLFIIMSSRNDKKLMRQQKELNVLLSKAVDAAENANRAKSEFLSHMSHDIRTPINGIMGMTGIAMKNMEDREKTMECLQKIDTASKHLLSLINDVLDMSRVESGKIVLNHKSMNLQAVLHNCASIITGQLVNRSLDFITEFEKCEHTVLLGDELRLRQVLINILGNAVKFTADGGTVRFHVEEIEHTDKTATFRFVVEDSGKGMKPSFLEKIFEPFSQEEGNDRSIYVGTGLGMAITKQFVDLMGGTIRAESEVNVGSKFTVEITFELAEDDNTVDMEEQPPVNLTGMKVLLVEDNRLNVEIAKYILEENGVLVTVAGNGQIAVELFEENPPETFDLILMDVMMPIMNGITATQTIRSMEREDAGRIPIVAMTANAYEEDIQKTREAGMNKHLSKPIDVFALLQTLSYYKRKGDSDAKNNAG